MRKKKKLVSSRSSHLNLPPEYLASKAKWEKKRNTVRYLRIWKKHIKKKNPLSFCPDEELYKAYGVHRPIDPMGEYPKYNPVEGYATSMVLFPSIFVSNENIDISKFGDKYYVSVPETTAVLDKNGDETDEVSGIWAWEDMQSYLKGRTKKDIDKIFGDLQLTVDLKRSKETVIEDFLNFINYYYGVREYLGVRDPQFRIRKKTKPRRGNVSRDEKLMYATYLLAAALKLSLREIADLPKTAPKAKKSLSNFRELSKEDQKRIRDYFQKLATIQDLKKTLSSGNRRTPQR